jgi:hypothetical protein
MREIKLTKELYLSIANEYRKFRQRTGGIYDVGLDDILYSCFESTPEKFAILNDWDEGPENDPFWDIEKDEHCVHVFLKEMVLVIESLQ